MMRRGLPWLVLALVVRVADVLLTRDWAPVSDPEDYIRHAVSIAGGDGFPESAASGGPSALRPPLYPYLLGAVFRLTGDSWTAGRLVSALCGVAAVALIGWIGARLWGERVGLVAMAIAAVYPPLVLVSGTLISEGPGLPLMLAVPALVLHWRDRPRAWVAAAAGAAFGLALLTRPAFSVLALVIVLGLWGRPWRSLGAAAMPALALAVAALLVIPWTARNAAEFGAFVPISTQGGFLLAGTYNPVSDADPRFPGGYRVVDQVPQLEPVLADRSLDERELTEKLGTFGREYALDHPGYVPRVFFWNGMRLLQLERPRESVRGTYRNQGIGNKRADVALAAYYALALLALAGAALGGLRGHPPWLWLTAVLLFVTVIGISSDTRYRLPLEPYLAWLAAYALVTLTDRRRGRPQPPTPQPPPRSPGPP